MYNRPPLDPRNAFTEEELEHWLKFKQIAESKGFHNPTISLFYLGVVTEGEALYVEGNRATSVFWPRCGGSAEAPNGVSIHGGYDPSRCPNVTFRRNVA